MQEWIPALEWFAAHFLSYKVTCHNTVLYLHARSWKWSHVSLCQQLLASNLGDSETSSIRWRGHKRRLEAALRSAQRPKPLNPKPNALNPQTPNHQSPRSPKPYICSYHGRSGKCRGRAGRSNMGSGVSGLGVRVG